MVTAGNLVCLQRRSNLIGVRLLGFTIPRVTETTLTVYQVSFNLYWPTVLMAFGYSADEDIQEDNGVTTSNFHARFMLGQFAIEITKVSIILEAKESKEDA